MLARIRGRELAHADQPDGLLPACVAGQAREDLAHVPAAADPLEQIGHSLAPVAALRALQHQIPKREAGQRRASGEGRGGESRLIADSLRWPQGGFHSIPISSNNCPFPSRTK